MKRTRLFVFSVFLLTTFSLLLVTSIGAQGMTYAESPLLAERVAAGNLPAVDERLPVNPKVIPTLDSIGTYGGTLRVGDTDQRLDESLRMRHTGLFRYNFTASEYQADLAESWEWTPDYRTLTISLREGLRWSDGDPFDTEDIAWHWNNVLNDVNVSPNGPGGFWNVGGSRATLEVIDSTTFSYTWAIPYPIAMDSFGRTHFSGDNSLYGPSHYLQQFHLDFNPEAQALAEAAGFATWVDLLNARRCQCYNPTSMPLDRPYLDSFIPIEVASDRILLERNPYFHQVDEAGNQLPYIDYFEVSYVSDQELYALKLTAGDFDFGVRYTRPSDLQLFRQNEEAGGYTTAIAQTLQVSAVSVFFNQNYPDAAFNELFGTYDFRLAMSVAINRDQINDILYFGLGAVHPPTPFFTTPWFDQAWYGDYLDYDPARANALLDGIGLTNRDSDEYRLLPDGRRAAIIVQGQQEHMRGCQLIANDWRAVGVELICQEVNLQRAIELQQLNETMGTVWHLERATLFGRGTPDNFAINDPARHYWGNQWASWIASGGTSGIEPPDSIKALNDGWLAFSQLPSDSPEAAEVGRAYFRYFVDELPIIPTIGLTPQPVIYANELRNVPMEGIHFSSDTNFYSPFHIERWYFAG
jgi:peptide/nickel transport system substrate-binding protein